MSFNSFKRFSSLVLLPVLKKNIIYKPEVLVHEDVFAGGCTDCSHDAAFNL